MALVLRSRRDSSTSRPSTRTPIPLNKPSYFLNRACTPLPTLTSLRLPPSFSLRFFRLGGAGARKTQSAPARRQLEHGLTRSHFTLRVLQRRQEYGWRCTEVGDDIMLLPLWKLSQHQMGKAELIESVQSSVFEAEGIEDLDAQLSGDSQRGRGPSPSPDKAAGHFSRGQELKSLDFHLCMFSSLPCMNGYEET